MIEEKENEESGLGGCRTRGKHRQFSLIPAWGHFWKREGPNYYCNKIPYGSYGAIKFFLIKKLTRTQIAYLQLTIARFGDRVIVSTPYSS
jgi:hypothetical protein